MREVNAVGKNFSASYDSNHKLRAAPTKIGRLRKPYGPSMRFVGEQQRETRRRRTRRPKPAPLLDLLANGSQTWL
jgi:hypothetical protein